MPASNPLFAWGESGEDITAVGYAPVAAAQGTNPADAQSGTGIGAFLNSVPNTTVNAAGTSQNVSLHVALVVVTALVAVYVFRASGFRFVAAAGAGGR